MKDDKKQIDKQQKKLADVAEDDGLALEDHRLSQDFGNLIGVKKAIISVTRSA